MINEIFYSNDLKKQVKQVSKPTAKKIFNSGKTVYFHSSNMVFDNVWQSPCPCNKETSYESNFENLCSDYMYYNCDNERGKYIHFFVEL